MLKTLLLSFFLVLNLSLGAQPGTTIDYAENQFSATLTYDGLVNGKHSYSDMAPDETIVFWTGTRWEVTYNNPNFGLETLFFSNEVTALNPPDLASGNWTMTPNNMSTTLVTLSGSGTTNAILPVTLISFKGEYSGKRVALAWETSEEIDNERFEVERSNAAGEFQKIGEVAGSGNSRETARYEFDDANPLPGNNNYRLRQVGFDGQFDYSAIVSVDVSDENGNREMLLSPNPVAATSPLTVGFFASTEEVAQLSIFNSLGQQVARLPQALRAGYNRLSVDLGNLASGNYVVRIDAGDESTNQKLIVR